MQRETHVTFRGAPHTKALLTSPPAQRGPDETERITTQAPSPRAVWDIPVPLVCLFASLAAAVWMTSVFTAPQMWFDEVATRAAVSRSLPELLDMLGTLDLVHGLYYIAMLAWTTVFGDSVASLRAPSVIAYSALVGVMGLIAAQYVPHRPRTAALCSAALTASLPGLHWTGMDARPYIFVALALAGALYFAVIGKERPSTKNTIAMAVCLGLAVSLSVMAVLALPAFVALRWTSRDKWWHAVRPILALAIVMAPFMLLAVTQVDQVTWIKWVPIDLGDSVMRSQFFSSSRETYPPTDDDLLGRRIAQLIFGLSLLAALMFRKTLSTVLPLVILLVVPHVVLVSVHLYATPLYQSRYLLFTAPAVILLVVLGLMHLPWRTLAVALTVVCVIGQSSAINGGLTPDGKFRESYGDLAAIRQDTDRTYYAQAIARSVKFATTAPGSPDAFATAEAGPSGTLFGTGQDASPQQLRYNGTFAVYQTVQRRDWTDEVNRLAELARCTMTSSFETGRLTARRYTCPTASRSSKEATTSPEPQQGRNLQAPQPSTP